MIRADVFVYGTLLFPEVTDELGVLSVDPATDRHCPLIRERATLSGYERFTVRLREHGNFPAIVLGDGCVEGQLLRELPASSLRILDDFEGISAGYYVREEVEVRLSNGQASRAFAYVCGEPLASHLDGPWHEEQFRVNDLQWYVANVVS